MLKRSHSKRLLQSGKKKLLPALVSLCALGAGSAQAQNGVMMQYFNWYLDNDGTLWQQVEQNAEALSDVGITALWLPPAYKGNAGVWDVGYGVYDMYDLGEFDQKNTVRTKYGTKDEYLAAIQAAHANGMQIYADVVFNHRLGADSTEPVDAVRVEWNNRNQEFGGDVTIEAWTVFDFAGRGNTYSDFKWRWYHFDGVDYDDSTGENSLFKFRGLGKDWEQDVANENGNYDYLMGADVDVQHPDVIDELKNWGEWYVDFTNVDGFRIDAIKHISTAFFEDWLNHMRTATGRELFSVGEYWSGDINLLTSYLDDTNGVMALFDAPLHYNFFAASNSNGQYDMRGIMDNTLMQFWPDKAVTLVDNHDTQPCQQLESPVQDWFKPLAYTFILLREEGYPNVFHADYYGDTYATDDKGCSVSNPIVLQSHKDAIDILLGVRRDFAYGEQVSYLDNPDIIGWTRLGDANHPHAMAAIITDAGGGSKSMYVGKANTQFYDVTGNRSETVTTDGNGWGNFSVNGGSHSVWIEVNTGPTPTPTPTATPTATPTPTATLTPTPTPDPGDVVLTNFQCFDGQTNMGQNIYVVGSDPVIGSWNTDNAVKLDPTNYPTWTGNIELPASTAIEWKCVRIGNGSVDWQPGSNNSVNTPSDGSTTTGSMNGGQPNPLPTTTPTPTATPTPTPTPTATPTATPTPTPTATPTPTPTATPTPTPTPVTEVTVNFRCENASTEWGQNIYVVGNIPELGNWASADAVKLDPTDYPTWTGSIIMQGDRNVQWKCIKRDLGVVEWESGANNSVNLPSSGSVDTTGRF